MVAGYAVGLLMANMAVYVMDMGQVGKQTILLVYVCVGLFDLSLVSQLCGMFVRKFL